MSHRNVNKQGLVDAVKKLQCWTRYDSNGHRYVNCEDGDEETGDHMRARPVSARTRKRLDDMAYDEDSDDVAIKRRRHALDQLGMARRERGLPARAKGGPVSKNKRYLVGEEGPERYVTKKQKEKHECWTRENKEGAQYVTCKEAQEARAEDKGHTVGKNGPELFVPKEDGTIIPNPKTKKRKADESYDDGEVSFGHKGKEEARKGALDDIGRRRALDRLVAARKAKGLQRRCDGGPVKKGTHYVVGEEGEEEYIPGRRNGGPVKKGKRYMVGEEGPEKFVPNRFAAKLKQRLSTLKKSGLTALLGPHGRTVDALLTVAPEAYDCAKASATYGGMMRCAFDAAYELYPHLAASLAAGMGDDDIEEEVADMRKPPRYDYISDEEDDMPGAGKPARYDYVSDEENAQKRPSPPVYDDIESDSDDEYLRKLRERDANPSDTDSD
jgi:SLT domain-containing protein